MMVGMDNVVGMDEYRARRAEARAELAQRSLADVLSGSLEGYLAQPVTSTSGTLDVAMLRAAWARPPLPDHALVLPPHWAPFVRQVLDTGRT